MSDVLFDSSKNAYHPLTEGLPYERVSTNRDAVVVFNHKCAMVSTDDLCIGKDDAGQFNGFNLSSSPHQRGVIESHGGELYLSKPDRKQIAGYDFPMDLSSRGTESNGDVTFSGAGSADPIHNPVQRHHIPHHLTEKETIPILPKPVMTSATVQESKVSSIGVAQGISQRVSKMPVDEKILRHRQIEAGYRERRKQYIKNFDQMISSLRLQCCQAAQALLENKSLLANGSSEYSSWTLTLLKLGSYEVINSYLCQWVDSLEQHENCLSPHQLIFS